MTSQDLTVLVSIIISLALSYIPGLAPWWDGQKPVNKRLVMFGLLVLVTGAVYGLSCAGWSGEIGLLVTCDKAGLSGLLRALVMAIVANQGVYAITPRPSYALAK